MVGLGLGVLSGPHGCPGCLCLDLEEEVDHGRGSDRMQVGLGWHPWGGGQSFQPVSLTLLSQWWRLLSSGPSHHPPWAPGHFFVFVFFF